MIKNIEKLYTGQKIAKSKNVLIMSLARDIEFNKHNLETFINFCNGAFNKCHFIFFENDSKDNTKKILKEYEQKYPITVLTDSFGWQQLTDNSIKYRLSKLESCRNRILDYIYQNINKYREYDILGIYDSDIRYVSFDGIFDSFAYIEKWDGITSNGICYVNGSCIYYDNMSLVKDGVLLNGYIRPPFINDILVPVECAFGGLAFYKSAFVDLKKVKFGYKNIMGEKCKQHPDIRPTSDHYMFCEHVRNNGGKIFINPNQLTYAYSV